MSQPTMEQQYLDTLRDIMENGESYHDRTEVGRKGVWQRTLRCDLSIDFPLLTTKKVPMRWVAEELAWFISGSTLERDLSQAGVDIWKEWATPEQTGRFGREEGDLGPVYGHQWRNFGATTAPGNISSYYCGITRRYVNRGYRGDGVDQIAWIVNEIVNNPSSTRLILSGWNPAEQDKVALPPCHTFCHFKVWPDGSLSSMLYQRSCDMFLGVPFNMASYALLTMLVAKVCGLRPREFVHQLGDAHIYSNHHAAVAEQLGREPGSPPFVTLISHLDGAGMDGLTNFKSSDVFVEDYNPQPSIKADVAV